MIHAPWLNFRYALKFDSNQNYNDIRMFQAFISADSLPDSS